MPEWQSSLSGHLPERKSEEIWLGEWLENHPSDPVVGSKKFDFEGDSAEIDVLGRLLLWIYIDTVQLSC